MSYQQTLWKEVKDIVNPKLLVKNNRFINSYVGKIYKN